MSTKPNADLFTLSERQDITKCLKFFIPIVCHYVEWSVIDLITLNPVPYTADPVTLLFSISLSLALLQWPSLLPERYRPVSEYIKLIVEVLVQILLTDLLLRTAGTAIQYVLYYACVRGYVAYLVNTFLFFLFTFDNYIPVSKFVRYSKTEEGFQEARFFLGYTVFLISLLDANVHLRLFEFLRACRCYLDFFAIPILQLLTSRFGSKKRRKRSRSKRRNSKK